MEVVYVYILAIVIAVESRTVFVSADTLGSIQPNTALWDVAGVFVKLLTLLM